MALRNKDGNYMRVNYFDLLSKEIHIIVYKDVAIRINGITEFDSVKKEIIMDADIASAFNFDASKGLIDSIKTACYMILKEKYTDWDDC